MKKYVTLIFFYFFFLKLYSQDISHSGICKERFSTAFNTDNLYSTTSVDTNFNLIYADCNWKIDPSVNYISGFVTYHIFSKNNSGDKIVFDLADPLIVDSVLFHNNHLNFLHSNNQLEIIFSSVIHQLTIDSISIYYQGEPVATGNGSFIRTDHSGAPVIQTLSEPYGARDWWPCKQDLSDKIDSISINVKTPLQYKTASNGKLIGEDSTTLERTAHWKSNYPVAAYLVAIAVTNYSTYSEKILLSNGDSLEILNYIYPENLTAAMNALSEIGPIIHLYDSLTIPYPFRKEKYGHAQFSWGGGMEHQTMSFIGNFSRELIAHECAHQWFGDDVTAGTWQDIWLHEGFATYFAALVLERYYPEEWEPWLRSNLGLATSLKDGSVFCPDTTSIQRIFSGVLTYRRGACLLHMLRWTLGDTAFFTGLKNYLQDINLNYSFVRTSDLQHHLEQSSGKNLDEFFDEWFYGEGFPEYKITWESNSEITTLEISQKASDNSSAFFHMPLPILLSDGINDTIVIADPQQNTETFTFTPGFIVNNVIFDPDVWILSGFNNVNERNSHAGLIGIYPTLIQNELNIFSKDPGTNVNMLSVISAQGKIVFEKSFNIISDDLHVPLPYISEGFYIARITTTNGIFNQKIVIER